MNIELIFSAMALFVSLVSLLLSARKQRFDIDKTCSEAIAKIYSELGAAMRRALDLRLRCARELITPDPYLGVEGMINILIDLEEEARRMRATIPTKSRRNPVQLAVAKAAAKELNDQLKRWEDVIDRQKSSNKANPADQKSRPAD